MNPNKMKLNPNKLKAARVAQGLYQQDIAEYLEISTESYSKRERGEIEFKLKEAVAISKLLGQPIEKIFCYQVE